MMKKIFSRITETIANIILDTLNDKLDKMKKEIQHDIKNVDENTCKNFLVRTLKDVEHGEKLDDVEYERFCEVYDHYTKDLHLNSYIHKKVEKLEKEGKL